MDTFHAKASGHWSVIDYVWLSSSVWAAKRSSHALLAFDMLHQEADHRPTCVSIRMPLVCFQQPQPRRIPCYSRQAVYEAIVLKDAKHQAAVDGYTRHLAAMPPVPYYVHPTEHAELIHVHVRKGLAEFFPAVPAQRKKNDAVSDATFDLIRHKSRVHKVVVYSAWCVGKSHVQFVFAFWSLVTADTGQLSRRGRRGLRLYCNVRGFVSKWLSLQWAFHSHNLDYLRKLVRAHVVQNKHDHVARAASELQEAALLANSGSLYRLLRRFTVDRAPRGQRLVLESGVAAATAVDEQRLFRDHFVSLSAGEVTTFSATVTSNTPARTGFRYADEDMSVFPSRASVSVGLSTAKLRKAVGEAVVGAEGYRVSPKFSARLLHPLLCKSLINAEAPVQWKGSQLAALYKGKGPRTQLKSYRDVALGDPDAKLYGKVLRKFLLRSVERMQPVMQFGSGLGGGGCDIPHLAVQSALHLGESRRCCVALLFLDVTTAFASMVRETVFPTSAGRSHWLHFLLGKGYPPDFAQEVMDAVVAVCDWEAAGLTPHALSLLEDFHTNTWFSTELLPGVATTRCGCTAGNPVADLVFVASDTLLARRLFAMLKAEGLAFCLDDSDARHYFGVDPPGVSHQISRIAYVDDSVIPVLGPASSILSMLSRAAAAAKFTYENHGLELNFSAGKSESVIAFHGVGAQQARHEVFVDRSGVIVCEGFGVSAFELRVVGKYKHLGGIVSGSCDLSAEIAPKMAIVRQTVRKLKKHFLRDSSVPLRKKAQVLQSLVLARGLNLAGTWPVLLPREARMLKRALVDMLRPLIPCGDEIEHRKPDDAIIDVLGVLCPLRLVSLMRLHLAIRLAARSPPEVLALLFSARASARSWLRALELDLEHISIASGLAELRGKPLCEWFAFFRSSPHMARKVVSKAIAETNWVSTVEQDAERESTTYCLICGDPALDRQSLAVHMCRAHGVKRYIRAYVTGLDCLVCGLRCVSRQRLIDHLSEKSPICSHNYVLRYDPLPDEEVHRIDVGARQDFSRRRRVEGAHGTRIHGPFLPVFSLDGSQIMSRHPLGPNRRWIG